MVAALQYTPTPLIEVLHGSSGRFELFQAIRLIELWGFTAKDAEGVNAPLGHPSRGQAEVVQLRMHRDLGFPATEVAQLSVIDAFNERSTFGLWQLDTGHFSLLGSLGVLPYHYSQYGIETLRNRQSEYVDFLDLFNHRLLSLFYRAWEKYRLPVAFEKSVRSRQALKKNPLPDPTSTVLESLAGGSPSAPPKGSAYALEDLKYYAELFSSPRPTVLGLKSLLESYFDTGVTITEFCGSWHPPAASDIFSFSAQHDQGGFRLGQNIFLGDRVYQAESGLEIRLGEVTLEQFLEFLPGKDAQKSLVELSRHYVGAEFLLKFQIVLDGASIPPLRLGEESPIPPLLGLTTWLPSEESVHADDYCFESEEFWPEFESWP